MNQKLYIVIPAYNEEENIEQVIHQWHKIIQQIGPESRLVIFNDGSKDKTFEIMQKVALNCPQFIPVSKANSGHGSTCLFAYNYAIEAGADFVFQTDSDGQTNPEEFMDFWKIRNEFDFVIGYRVQRQDGFSRVIVTNVLKATVWLIFGERVKDCNTPFRLMKSVKLKPILDFVPKDFFLSNVIISMLIVKRSEAHTWLPITFKPRQGGVNSIDFKKIVKIGYKAISDFSSINRKLKMSN